MYYYTTSYLLLLSIITALTNYLTFQNMGEQRQEYETDK